MKRKGRNADRICLGFRTDLLNANAEYVRRKEKDLGITADGAPIPFNLEWECRERKSVFPLSLFQCHKSERKK